MNLELSASVYSVCTLWKPGESIERYLYDHTTIVDTYEKMDGRAVHVLRTTSTDVVALDKTPVRARKLAENAEYLATYQCERLASGLHVARVCGSFDDAMREVGRLWADLP